MQDDVVVLPVAGSLSSDSTPDDFEIARRRAADWHVRQALSLWPDYNDLVLWMTIRAVQMGLAPAEVL